MEKADSDKTRNIITSHQVVEDSDSDSNDSDSDNSDSNIIV